MSCARPRSTTGWVQRDSSPLMALGRPGAMSWLSVAASIRPRRSWVRLTSLPPGPRLGRLRGREGWRCRRAQEAQVRGGTRPALGLVNLAAPMLARLACARQCRWAAAAVHNQYSRTERDAGRQLTGSGTADMLSFRSARETHADRSEPVVMHAHRPSA
jgi:hypothetical protein